MKTNRLVAAVAIAAALPLAGIAEPAPLSPLEVLNGYPDP